MGRSDESVLMTVVRLQFPNEEIYQLSLIEKEILSYTISIFALAPMETSWAVVPGSLGTGCLVQTETQSYILTANHVAAAVIEGEPRRFIAGNGTKVIDISDWPIIDSSIDLDVATIRVPQTFSPEMINKAFYRPIIWPPQKAQVAEFAAFVGFAGIHTKSRESDIVQATAFFRDKVASSSGRHFIIAPENTRTVYKFDEHLTDFGPIGGVSGSAVFVERNEELVLAGIIYEGGDTYEATFFAAHADFVCADGSIDRARESEVT